MAKKWVYTFKEGNMTMRNLLGGTGGITDGTTADALAALGISIDKTLANNDAYHALKACGGLIVTGPTGTNVNDITVLLV